MAQRRRLPTAPLERPLQAHRRAVREHLAHVDALRSELEAEGMPTGLLDGEEVAAAAGGFNPTKADKGRRAPSQAVELLGELDAPATATRPARPREHMSCNRANNAGIANCWRCKTQSADSCCPVPTDRTPHILCHRGRRRTDDMRKESIESERGLVCEVLEVLLEIAVVDREEAYVVFLEGRKMGDMRRPYRIRGFMALLSHQGPGDQLHSEGLQT